MSGEVNNTKDNLRVSVSGTKCSPGGGAAVGRGDFIKSAPAQLDFVAVLTLVAISAQEIRMPDGAADTQFPRYKEPKKRQSSDSGIAGVGRG